MDSDLPPVWGVNRIATQIAASTGFSLEGGGQTRQKKCAALLESVCAWPTPENTGYPELPFRTGELCGVADTQQLLGKLRGQL